jgi:thiamine-monophosphate kinase
MNEFELIKHCFNWPQNNSDIICAVGDDASIVQVPSGYELVQSIDTQVADVHFPASAPPQLIAQRALRCAISDLAAMGAKPQAFHLALSLPKDTSKTWLESFSSGLRNCADEYSISLIGGDTTSCPSIVITIQVQGIVPSGKALTRDKAQAADNIWVTGNIGDAAGALPLILNNPELSIDLAKAYYYPQAQIQLGLALVGIANSALDISDGLLQDASHIAKASNCTLNIHSDRIPLSPLLRDKYPYAQALDYALTGGDDYQILFTAPTESDNKILNIAQLLSVPCTKIGHVIATSSPSITLDGIDTNNLYHDQGYQHFNDQ